MEPIVVRDRGPQAMGVVFLLCAGLMVLPYVFIAPAHRTGDGGGYLLIAVFGTLGLGLLVTGSNALAADDEGLTVWTFRKERRFPWRSVTDFHIVRGPHGARDVVEADGVPCASWGASHPQAEALRALVLARAVRATAREWAPAGSRAVEAWPRTFAYVPPRNFREAAAMITALTLGLAAWAAWSVHAVEMPPIPLAYSLGMVAVVMVMVLTWPAIALAISVASERDFQRRRHQRVTAREHGLRYEDERREVAMGWGEIERVTPHAGGAVGVATLSIESRRGAFEVSANLGDLSRLRELLARRAPAAVALGLAAAVDPNDLLRLAPVPGVAVHHYRTRESRALLVLLAFFALAYVWAGVSARSPVLACLVAPLLALAGAPLLNNYLFVRVQVDALGITFRRRTGSRFVAWRDVTGWRQVEAQAFTHLVLDAGGERRRVWANVLDFGGLRDALAARMPPTAPPDSAH